MNDTVPPPDGTRDERQCPACSSRQVLPIQYGLPDRDAYEQGRGRVVFGGCCVPPSAPTLSCRDCLASWGPVERVVR